ncbi:MAG: hypothetical protein ACLFPL_02355 [Candidatus Nanoarchaeia archaeon]
MSSIQKTLLIEDSVEKEIEQYSKSLSKSFEKQKLSLDEEYKSQIQHIEDTYREKFEEEKQHIESMAQDIITTAQSRAKKIHIEVDTEQIINKFMEGMKK